MQIRLPARIGAFACLGVAATMAVLALREEPEPSAPPIVPATTSAADPLRAKLTGCQLEGEAAASDATCLAAWAENRRRFLGGSRPPGRLSADPSNAADGASLPQAN